MTLFHGLIYRHHDFLLTDQTMAAMASIHCSAIHPVFNQLAPFAASAISIQLDTSARWKTSQNFPKCDRLSVNNNINTKEIIGWKRLSVGCHPPQAASEGLPTELIEDPKFVPLSKDDPRFGPPALLFLGFKNEEIPKVQALLKEMDGEFLKVILCTEDMVKFSLWDAMSVQQPDLKNVKVADGLPRICFLSGLSGEETLMFIDAFHEAGLEPAVFAALVPNSAGKSLEELIEEIMGDHERLTGQPPQP